jgi:Family of unknown function (DUF5677)
VVDYVIGLAHVSYESEIVPKEALEISDTEEAFDLAAFRNLKELLQSTRVVSRLLRVDDLGRPRDLSRNEAILAGLMVRCTKLQEGALRVCEPQMMELLLFFQRGITESAVNLAYLVECGTSELYDAFVKDSLRVEKARLVEIERNVAERGGVILPIEHRMMEGIEAAFAKGEIELDGVSVEGRRKAWSPKGMFGRFQAIGYEDRYAIYEIQSGSQHGNWHELSTYHLNHGEHGGFIPNLDFSAIRPIPLLLATEVLADASKRYLRDVVPDNEERAVLEDRIEICHQKGQEIGLLHEGYLGRVRAGTAAPPTGADDGRTRP